jgi:hypothetical protein
MDKLSNRELTSIRRAAEDAIEAWNRNHKPFIDVVAHPLNICTLVDMAKLSLTQQKLIDELQARVDAVCLVLDGLKKARYMHSENKKYNSILIEKLEQALKGGEV